MRIGITCLVLALGIDIGRSATAAAANPAPAAPRIEALRTCRAVVDPANRIACYDNAVDALLAATASKELVVLDKSEIRSARRGLFGFSLPRIPFLDNTTSKAEALETKRLVTKVKSLSRPDYGRLRFRTEDGALWETVEASSDLSDLRPGDTITLVRGMLGAFFLEQRNARVQARRIPEANAEER